MKTNPTSRITTPTPASATEPVCRPIVDTHAHVFTDACAMEEQRRYTPSAEAPLEAYLTQLDRCGVPMGVLVQPSFLGTDNTYLLDAIARCPDRLRGVAVLSNAVSDETLENMDARGICGLRYNLVGDDPEKLKKDEWRSLTRRVTSLGWHIEVHVDGTELPGVVDTLAQQDATIVFDHFGRPVPALGDRDPGFQRLITDGPSLPVWIKLSAPYRFSDGIADNFAAAFIETLGPERLMWGSDWPWTRFENSQTYEDCIGWLARWFRNDWRAVERLNAASLSFFRFPQSARSKVANAIS
ncbi:MAG: amidohydrolase family protein [Hyphomicrobiaceae bacterium]